MTTTSPSPSADPVDRTSDVIRTEGLTKVYAGADFRAVDSLDLVVGAGEIFGLLGPNGAGKTTTAGMLTTRVIPTGGKAFVDGVDVVAHPTRAKQVIGVVPQTNTLDRSLDVFENLYFHGRFFGMSARTAKAEAAWPELLETSFRDTDISSMAVATELTAAVIFSLVLATVRMLEDICSTAAPRFPGRRWPPHSSSRSACT